MAAGFALAGWLVRRAGARALLVGSLALVALGALGSVLGDSLAAYFPARLLMGRSGGIWIGVTFDTLERWPGQEYLCMSRVFAAYSVGGLIGPALGVFGGIHGPFLAYLGLLLLAVPLVLFVAAPTTRREFAADRAALRTRGFWVASAAILFAVLALGVLEGVLPLHFAERLSQAQIGALYVGASIIVAASAGVSGGCSRGHSCSLRCCWPWPESRWREWLRASRSGSSRFCWPASGSVSGTRARSDCSSKRCRWSGS